VAVRSTRGDREAPAHAYERLVSTMSICVVSPHLDDAVLGCAGLLAEHREAAVVTVFAGMPPPGVPVPEWDAACGFASAPMAIATRREEDRAALAMLGARPLWLEFLDSQYAASPSVETVSAALRRSMPRTATTAFPLGLFHSDHRLASEAVLRLASASPDRTWLVYEEALYRRIPGLVEERVAALERTGFTLSRCRVLSASRSLKEKAIGCYASQLRGLASPGRPGYRDALDPESYWRLAP